MVEKMVTAPSYSIIQKDLILNALILYSEKDMDSRRLRCIGIEENKESREAYSYDRHYDKIDRSVD